MNETKEIYEIRYNKIRSEIDFAIYILKHCKNKILINKVNGFATNEYLFFFLIDKMSEIKEKVANLGKLLEV